MSDFYVYGTTKSSKEVVTARRFEVTANGDLVFFHDNGKAFVAFAAGK